MQLCLLAFLDVSIHYDGATPEEIYKVLCSIGITDYATAENVYTYIAEEPANYLKYYVGYLNFQDLQTYLKGELGKNFSLKEYHARVLKIGPCSFRILKAYLTDTEYLLS